MTKQIDPQLKLISEYLKTSKTEKFVIPEYQRAYSWNIVHCDKLWQDIEAFIESDTIGDSGKKDPYFFGTIIVDCSQTNELSLIDGQQRTTTFILLLKALLIRIMEVLSEIKKDEETESLIDGLKERRNQILDILYQSEAESRSEILKDWNRIKDIVILENRSINEDENYKNDLKLIVEADNYLTAEGRCHKIKFRRNDNRFTNYFRNFKYFYNRLISYNESRVNRFAKSLLGECQVIEIRSWQTEQAITMFNSLNSTGLPLSDADIISAQLYSYAGEDKVVFNDKWQEIIKMTKILDSRDIVKLDAVLQQYMYIQRAKDRTYISTGRLPDVTTPGLRKYYTMDRADLLKKPMELCESFLKIIRIWDRIKDYPIIRLLMRFNVNSRIYLISYLNKFDEEGISERNVTEIAETLIRLFAVLELVDAGYSSAKFKTFLFGENIKFVDKTIGIEEIVKDFTNHISKEWDYNDLKQRLEEYDKNILVYLNDYIYAKNHGIKLPLGISVNVEHIMPSSGRELETIRIDAGIETKEEFLEIVNNLGNKILLEEDINKSISNEWFKTKKQSSIIQKTGYKDSRYPLAHSLTTYPQDVWTKEDIKLATQKAAKRIVDFIFGANDESTTLHDN